MRSPAVFFILLLILFMFFIHPGKLCAVEARLHLTTDRFFFERFEKTDRKMDLAVKSADSVSVGQGFKILLFVSNCKSDRDGQGNVLYDLLIKKPDRQIYYEKKDMIAVAGSLKGRNEILSKTNVGLKFEACDKKGKYQIIIRVRDLAEGHESRAVSSIILRDFKECSEFTDGNLFMKWMENYYKNPAPENVVCAFIYFSEAERSADKTQFEFCMSFFAEVYKNNKFLVPRITHKFRKMDKRARLYLIHLLGSIGDIPDDLQRQMSVNEKKYSLYITQKRMLCSYTAAEKRKKMLRLKAEFFASGAFLPVMKMSELMTTGETPGSSSLLLTDMVKNHPLVYDYCSSILKDPATSPAVKKELKKIIKK